MRLKMLLVLANPWLYIDHKGRPAGVVPKEPSAGTNDSREFVGAKLCPKRTRITKKLGRGELRSAPQDTVWLFAKEPVKVPNTPYYRRHVQRGDLVAGDEATAKACGVKFEDPSKRLAALKDAAVDRFDSDYGKGTFDALGQEWAAECAARDEVEAEAKKTAPAEKPKQTAPDAGSQAAPEAEASATSKKGNR